MGDGVDLFVRFFRAVHGVEPFAWQRALAERVIEGEGWPRAVDVPTGLGKTAALDVAVVALAAQADVPPERRTAPTRTFMVVDRRLLVDQAFERARRIAAALEAPEDPAVALVADRLLRIGGGPRALEVVRMRGGVTWSWRWLASPAQPAVIAGTVDQFGSRLLFRGYGVGERLRPIDAALCGRDALVLLDEAHLAPALAETLDAAHRLESRADRPILPGRAPRAVLLSATLRAGEVETADVVRANPDQERSEAARRRFGAARRLALCELDAAGRDGRTRLARSLAGLAARALDDPDAPPSRLAVVANTVPAARAVFEDLRDALRGRADVALLVGRCRGFEREHLGLADKIREAFAAVEPRPPRELPAVLVATQTIEVGADLDVDLLITEAAPLDALLQRLGRLNRLGLRGQAEAVCVFARVLHEEDWVYGDRIGRTWEWLRERVDREPVELDPRRPDADDAPTLEAGLARLGSLVGTADLERCAAEPVDVPILLAPYLDAWARTSPGPEPDQPVHPFLHGLDRGSPEVSVCWRAALPSVEALQVELEALPIREDERVEVPLWAARRFLRGIAAGPLADLEAVPDPEERESTERGATAFVQHADGSVERLEDPRRIRPGDVVIVDPEAGGHDAWGWTGSPGFTPDVADLVPRPRAAIRLRPAILAWVTGDDPDRFRVALSRSEIALRETADALLATAVEKARAGGDLDPVRARWVDHAERMRRALAEGQARIVDVGGPAARTELGLIVQARRRVLVEQASDDGEAATSVASLPIPLSQHAEDVGRRARALAARIGLPGDLERAAELAGYLHDAGKAERRFQVMLHRGDEDRLEASGVVLAKSGMDPAERDAFRRARQRSGLPPNWRHEAVSLAIADLVLDGASGADELLVRHLVATHHGSARPLFPPSAGLVEVDLLSLQGAVGPIDVSASPERLMVDHVDWSGPRRVELLCRRYGWWGLALLEAVVRLADIAVSEEYG